MTQEEKTIFDFLIHTNDDKVKIQNKKHSIIIKIDEATIKINKDNMNVYYKNTNFECVKTWFFANYTIPIRETIKDMKFKLSVNENKEKINNVNNC